MPPVTIMMKPVSGNCNMRCSYCFYVDEMNNRSTGCHKAMTEDTLERVVRLAFIYGEQYVTFAFQGGEPTLAGVTFFRNFLRLEKKYNIRKLPVIHIIQTNGLSLCDDFLDLLVEGKFLVGVSVDGIKEIHDSRRIDVEQIGTYDRVNESIYRMIEKNIPYNILCVVDNEVARHAEACYKQLKKHGYIQFIACLEPFGQHNTVLDPYLYGEFLIKIYRLYSRDFRNNSFVSVNQFDNWLNMIHGYKPTQCGMTGHCSINLTIESNGDVYPCDFYALDQWTLGNIKDSNFKKMVLSDSAKDFVNASILNPEQCKSCSWFSLCRGGCRRDCEPVDHSKKLVINRLCESYRMFFSECYEDMRQLAARYHEKRPKREQNGAPQ